MPRPSQVVSLLCHSRLDVAVMHVRIKSIPANTAQSHTVDTGRAPRVRPPSASDPGMMEPQRALSLNDLQPSKDMEGLQAHQVTDHYLAGLFNPNTDQEPGIKTFLAVSITN